ncbi:ORF3 [Simian adenovirus 17]|uniref:ORF3 n=1 Tax=Simian adenovirus 17 TaxID=1715779 RepID=A0A2H4CK47_9ADEN|nr:ORF3 [Simian adenovirus 17]
MRVCLRMAVEGALSDLFERHGVNLQEVFTQILREWKEENYLGVIQSCSLMFEDFEENAVAALVFLEVRVAALLEAVIGHLENRIMFDLAVIYHQRSGGDRCHLRELHFDPLFDRLE